jgi:hypothetical protein
LSSIIMPKCPHCSEELRIKFSGKFVSEIDEEYFSLLETFLQRMPRFVRGAVKSQWNRLNEEPPLVNLIVCSWCDTVISAELQKLGSR